MSKALDIRASTPLSTELLVRNHIHWLGKSRVFCSCEHLNLARLAGRDWNVIKENLLVRFVLECNRSDSIIFQSCVKNAQQVPQMTC